MIKHGNNGLAISLLVVCLAAVSSPVFGDDDITARPLDSFPTSDRVWLGSFGAEVEVNPATEILSNRSGDIRWLIEDGEQVAAEQAIAHMAEKQIRQSATQLELDEAKLPAQKRSATWNHHDMMAGLQRQLDEIHTRLAKIELSPEERKLIGAALTARLAAEREQLQTQINQLNEQLSPELADEQLRLELSQLDQDIESARLKHEELIRSMEIIAEHDGVLEIESTGYVRANHLVGHIRREGHAVVAIQLTDPDVRSENPETIGLTVIGPDGNTFDGRFTHLIRGRTARFPMTTYFFDLEPDAAGNPPPIDLTGERMATIHKMLPEKASIITKSPLLFSHPDEINRMGWAGFLKKAWPEARVVYIGPQSIALASEP